jgi:hypothetical protein
LHCAGAAKITWRKHPDGLRGRALDLPLLQPDYEACDLEVNLLDGALQQAGCVDLDAQQCKQA